MGSPWARRGLACSAATAQRMALGIGESRLGERFDEAGLGERARSLWGYIAEKIENIRIPNMLIRFCELIRG